MTDQSSRSRAIIADEAANWFVQLRDSGVTREVKENFAVWILESPVHVQEYLSIAKVWGELELVNISGEIESEDLQSEVVVPFGTDAETSVQCESIEIDKGFWTRTKYGIAAGLISAIVATGYFLFFSAVETTRYRTDLGEQRSVILQDGSIVSMNTLTEIEVSYKSDLREVNLLNGEALFQVVKEPARPFLVQTDTALVEVIGTKFNIYKEDSGTSVTVLEGQVSVTQRAPHAATQLSPASAMQVAPPDAVQATANLSVGEQAVVATGSPVIQTHALIDLEPVTAWTERRLVFDTAPLSEIVAQFNRYNLNRLNIDDTDLVDLALSGVFNSNDPDSLIVFLERVAEIDVIKNADGSRTIVRVENKRQ